MPDQNEASPGLKDYCPDINSQKVFIVGIEYPEWIQHPLLPVYYAIMEEPTGYGVFISEFTLSTFPGVRFQYQMFFYQEGFFNAYLVFKFDDEVVTYDEEVAKDVVRSFIESKMLEVLKKDTIKM